MGLATWSLFLQPRAGALEEGLEHFGDALLECGAEAALARERGERVQLAPRLPSKLDALLG